MTLGYSERRVRVSIVVSSSSSETRLWILLGSADELRSGGGVIVKESLGDLCGYSASALRFRFADLDLAMVAKLFLKVKRRVLWRSSVEVLWR